MATLTLQQAVYQNNVYAIDVLLNSNSMTINSQDNYRDTALHIATANTKLEIMHKLLTKGANPNIRNSDGITPLHFAVLNGNIEQVDLLLQFNTNLELGDHEGNTALHLSVHSNNAVQLAQLLLSRAPRLVKFQNVGGQTALHFAVVHRNVPLTAFLVRHCEINCQTAAGQTALMLAIDNELQEPTRLLIKAGAKLDIQDNQGWTAVHYAAVGKYQLISSYLDFHGADFTARTKKGWTALHCAANAQALEPLKYLRRYSFPQCDKDGNTPLHLAVRKINVKTFPIIRDLLQRTDANCKQVNKHGENMLHIAVKSIQTINNNNKNSRKNTTIYRRLFKLPINLNTPNHAGDTLLHIAVQYRNWSAVDELLNPKLNVQFVRNKQGKLPQDIQTFRELEDRYRWLVIRELLIARLKENHPMFGVGVLPQDMFKEIVSWI